MLPKTSSSLIAGWQHESKLYFFQVYLTIVFKFAPEPIFPNEVFFFQICEWNILAIKYLHFYFFFGWQALQNLIWFDK